VTAIPILRIKDEVLTELPYEVVDRVKFPPEVRELAENLGFQDPDGLYLLDIDGQYQIFFGSPERGWAGGWPARPTPALAKFFCEDWPWHETREKGNLVWL
jgi:hypothetical protein